ncbi:MAG TPA: hypothetical protein VLN90_09300 [Thioalkalivibrio sp.]|nr:hypothetical protein [Thioalkalivibrio sp.]
MLIKRLGDLLIFVGVLVCIAPVLMRLAGHYYLLGFELGTVLLGGIAILVMACLARLEVLLRK